MTTIPERHDTIAARSATWSVHIAKEYLKFSSAHFMIFEDGTAERLHGHNYRVEAEIESSEEQGGIVIDFHVVKGALRHILATLDERMLLPGLHPDVEIREHDGQVDFDYADRHYSMPEADVVVLPITNSSSEQLAKWIADELLVALSGGGDAMPFDSLKLSVEETAGQSGAVRLTR